MPHNEIESNFRPEADRVADSAGRNLLAEVQNNGPAPERSAMPDTAAAHLPTLSISEDRGSAGGDHRGSGGGEHVSRHGDRDHSQGHGQSRHGGGDALTSAAAAAPAIVTPQDGTVVSQPPVDSIVSQPPASDTSVSPPPGSTADVSAPNIGSSVPPEAAPLPLPSTTPLIPSDTSNPVSAPAQTNPPVNDSNTAVTFGSGGNFSVTPQGFVDNQGKSWNMAGLNAGVTDALNGFANMKSDFPGLTAIRLNVNPGQDSQAQVDQVIQEYTKAGIVVEAEDHSGNGDNVGWYTQMAQTYKDNPLVMLETPNEPSGDAQTVASEQIGIINAIRGAGFNNPIGIQPVGGYDQSNIPIVTAAVGTSNEFVTPHIYYSGTDPNGAMSYAQGEVAGANANGLYAAIDEFGNAMDGYTLDPQGQSVIDSVVQLNQQGYNGEKNVGAIFWAADNGNHPDGTDSAFATPDGSVLTPVGQNLSQSWLS